VGGGNEGKKASLNSLLEEFDEMLLRISTTGKEGKGKDTRKVGSGPSDSYPSQGIKRENRRTAKGLSFGEKKGRDCLFEANLNNGGGKKRTIPSPPTSYEMKIKGSDLNSTPHGPEILGKRQVPGKAEYWIRPTKRLKKKNLNG